ncbi:MAG: F-box protein [Nitrososphaerota archaeon]
MLTIVPLDTVRSVFEFLDLKSLIRCRTLCKYIKYIVDYDFVLLNYQKYLINLYPLAKFDDSDLRKALEQLADDSPLKLFTATSEAIKFNKIFQKSTAPMEPNDFSLYSGEHLWAWNPQKPLNVIEQPFHGHAIVVSVEQNVWESEVICFDGVYQRFSLLSWFGDANELYEIEYPDTIRPASEIVRIAEKIEETKIPKATQSDEWKYSVQFAIFCRTKRYLYKGKAHLLIPKREEVNKVV